MPAEPRLPVVLHRLHVRANWELVSTPAVFAGIKSVVQAGTAACFTRCSSRRIAVCGAGLTTSRCTPVQLVDHPEDPGGNSTITLTPSG